MTAFIEHRSDASLSLLTYVMSIWQRRYFWTSLVVLDLQSRYRRSILGLGWTLINPIAMTSILCFAFYRLFDLSIRDFAPYILSGMACWSYLSTVIIEGCRCFYTGENYIRSVPAPLAIYTLRTTLGATIHFLIVFFVTLLVVLLFRGLDSFAPMISLLPTLMLMFVFAWSAATITAFLNVFFPDIQHIVSVGIQLLFYLTPVIYPPSVIVRSGYQHLLPFNPIAGFMELVRAPLLQGEWPTTSAYGIALAWTAVCAAVAVLVLRRFERNVIFYL